MNISEPKPYEFCWDGSCAPGSKGYFGGITFSVGIFQWIPKAGGRGLKRGKVIKRIKGLYNNPEEAYQRATRICKNLNRQWAESPGSIIL